MAAPPIGTPGGQTYGRDFGEIIRRYVVRWTSTFRLIPAIQPVAVFDTPERLTKRLFPPSYIGGVSAAPAVAAQFSGIQLRCGVDSIIRAVLIPASVIAQIDQTGASLVPLWTQSSTQLPNLAGQLGVASKNILSIGASGVQAVFAPFTSSIYGSEVDWFVPAGGVFQLSNVTVNVVTSCGLWWDEPTGTAVS